jgi:hypothetical protein
MEQELTDARVAIAVLQTNYENLTTRVGEFREEVRAQQTSMGQKMDALGGKFDLVIQGMREREAASKVRARIATALSHVATGSVTLAAIKWLHIPLSLG